MATYSIFDCDNPNPAAIIGDPDNELNVEADVIVTSVILGFICSRYYQRQSCQFDFEHPNQKESEIFSDLDSKTKEELIEEAKKKYEGPLTWESTAIRKAMEELSKKGENYANFLKKMQEFYLTLDALSEVVDRQEPGMGKWLQDGQSPFGKEGELITGKKGGEMVSPESRETPLTLSKAAMLDNAIKKKNTVYQGRGAYTGLIENPVKSNTTLYPTMRVTPNANERRWQGIDGKNNWGLIRAAPDGRPSEYYNLNPDLKIGMGPLPQGSDNTQIGYVHGMCSAIINCVDEGTWCTPYEMATGEETTKMASCFPCSTFMYASGYPPTSIHLGRGESWVPPQSGDRLELDDVNGPLSGNKKVTGCNDALCKNTSAKWHLEIHQQMDLGVQCLEKAEKFISVTHFAKLVAFKQRLDRDKTAGNLDLRGGALFLDALTMHDKEVDRVRRTLKPVYETLTFMTEKILS